jgi:hypothetical protein
MASVAVAALGLAGFSLPSQAVMISSAAKNPYNFTWSYSTPDGLLTGSGTLTVSGWGSATVPSNTLSVLVSLTNTSSKSSNRLTAFGFGIDPNATGVTFEDSGDGGMVDASMSKIPSLAKIEICAYGGQNCNGGSNGGLLGLGGPVGSNTDIFVLKLAGTWGNSVNINPIGFKYQTAGESYEFTAPGGSVPAPGPLALFGFGLAALLVRRRLQAS